MSRAKEADGRQEREDSGGGCVGCTVGLGQPHLSPHDSVKAELAAAAAVLIILAVVLYFSDFFGEPERVLDAVAFVAVAAVFAVRIWFGRHLPRG